MKRSAKVLFAIAALMAVSACGRPGGQNNAFNYEYGYSAQAYNNYGNSSLYYAPAESTAFKMQNNY